MVHRGKHHNKCWWNVWKNWGRLAKTLNDPTVKLHVSNSFKPESTNDCAWIWILVNEALMFMENYFEKLQRRDIVQSALERNSILNRVQLYWYLLSPAKKKSKFKLMRLFAISNKQEKGSPKLFRCTINKQTSNSHSLRSTA